MKRFLFSFVLLALILAPQVGFAYSSGICNGDPCKESEVGAFMKGITKDCGNLGNCELRDIMIVVANVGNFVLGVVGGLVLLMYIIGGIFMLSSGGNPTRIDKGKKFLKISTTGLVIILFAYIGISTLMATLTGAEIGTEIQIDCTDPLNDGEACLDASVCKAGVCQTMCSAVNGAPWSCTPNEQANRDGYTCKGTPCPGGSETTCCRPK